MPFEKDDPRINREGRPKGTKNFETDFDEAVDEIAKENKITRSEARKMLLKVAFKRAKEGDYSFYKDIHDRIYGKAQDNVDLTSKGEKIVPIYGGNSIPRHNSDKENIPTEPENPGSSGGDVS